MKCEGIEGPMDRALYKGRKGRLGIAWCFSYGRRGICSVGLERWRY